MKIGKAMVKSDVIFQSKVNQVGVRYTSDISMLLEGYVGAKHLDVCTSFGFPK